MPKQQSHEETKRFLVERPCRERIFYANAASFAFNESQEAIIDFRLVMPEDLGLTTISQVVEQDEEEVISAETQSIDLRRIPVEVRVYMPINQFNSFVQRMARLWESLKENEGRSIQEEASVPVNSSEGKDEPA